MDNKLNILLNKTADIALRRRAKWLITNLNPKKGERILDLGCGDGFYLYLLSRLNLKLILHGADYDRNAINSAKKNLDSNKVKLTQADLMKRLPFSDEFFDGIVMSEVMEHLPDDIKCMKEARRVLKKNGRLVLSVPHINYPFFWDPVNWILQRILKTHIKSGFWAGIWNQHSRLYSGESLKCALKESGFRDIKIAKLTHFCLPFNHHMINLGARTLVNKTVPAFFKKEISKFDYSNEKTNNSNIFWVIFKFDALNDSWIGDGGTVSLVAICKK